MYVCVFIYIDGQRTRETLQHQQKDKKADINEKGAYRVAYGDKINKLLMLREIYDSFSS